MEAQNEKNEQNEQNQNLNQFEKKELLELPEAHLIQKIAFNEEEKREDIKRLQFMTTILITTILLLTTIFMLGRIDIDNLKEPLFEVIKIVSLVLVGNAALFLLSSQYGRYKKEIYNLTLQEELEYTSAYMKKEGLIKEFKEYDRKYNIEQRRHESQLEEELEVDENVILENNSDKKTGGSKKEQPEEEKEEQEEKKSK